MTQVKNKPQISNFVKLTDELLDEFAQNPDVYITKYSIENKIYRRSIGKISKQLSDDTYLITFKKYEFWGRFYTININEIVDFSDDITHFENLPEVNDYAILSGDSGICQVKKKTKSNLRWELYYYEVQQLVIGKHDGKGLIGTNEESINHFSKNLLDMEQILDMKKYNL